MAIAYVDSTFDGSTNAVATPAVPTGVNDGDLLLCILYVEKVGGPIFAAPVGWTEEGTRVNVNDGTQGWALYSKVASSESGSYNFGSASNILNGAAVIAYSGVNTSGAIDVLSNTGYETYNTTVRAASVTTTVANTMLVALASAYGQTFSSVPSGMSSRENSTYSSIAINIADVAQAGAGASGNKDFTLGSSTYWKHAFLVAVAPQEVVTGTGAAQVGATQVSGAGTVTITGTGALQIGAVTVAGQGATADIISTGGGATIGAVSVSGQGTVAITGTGAVEIGAVTTDGTGTVSVTGTGAVQIGAVQIEGTGGAACPGPTFGGTCRLQPIRGGRVTIQAITGGAVTIQPIRGGTAKIHES